jgi:cell division protein FtsB
MTGREPDRADRKDRNDRPDRAERAERGDRVPRNRRGRPGAAKPGARPETVRTRRPSQESSRRAGQEGQRPRRPQRAVPKPRRHPAAVLGLSTTRRAAMFAIVVCALALSVAVPLRTYLGQRAEVEVQQQKQAQLRSQVQQLEQRKAQLNDPAQVEAEARRRLRYVRRPQRPGLRRAGQAGAAAAVLVRAALGLRHRRGALGLERLVRSWTARRDLRGTVTILSHNQPDLRTIRWKVTDV